MGPVGKQIVTERFTKLANKDTLSFAIINSCILHLLFLLVFLKFAACAKLAAMQKIYGFKVSVLKVKGSEISLTSLGDTDCVS